MMPRRAASFFQFMDSKSTCATTGGSLTGLMACCPVCGYPDLDGIEPETLHLLAGAEAVAGYLLPNGLLPVHAKGCIYLMPQDKWTRYKALCANREAMASQMEAAA